MNIKRSSLSLSTRIYVFVCKKFFETYRKTIVAYKITK